MAAMDKKTGWEIQCACGGWTPLNVNVNGRFYFDHHGCKGGTYAGRLPQDISEISDIEAMGLHKVRMVVDVTALRNETKGADKGEGEAPIRNAETKDSDEKKGGKSDVRNESKNGNGNPFALGW